MICQRRAYHSLKTSHTSSRWCTSKMHQGTFLILVVQTFAVFQIICGQAADYQVRLADSGNRCSGRLEIQKNGQWGTVCDDLWDMDNAQVVCRQLGCGSAISAPPRSRYGWGTGPIWLDDVQCSGNELSIMECSHQGLGVHNCFHGEDASVECEGASDNTLLTATTTFSPSYSVRLVGSNSTCSGRVEVQNNSRWGTVCDDLWDLEDAHVVCRQLGCGNAISSPRQAAFGEGNGPIWFDDVECFGNESSITDCRHSGVGFHNCGHSEDASVICEGEMSNNSTGPSSLGSAPVRLVNSDSRCSGRVEIFFHGQWGTVCDDSWDMTNGDVVCQQLGCGNAVSTPHNARFGEGRGPIWFDGVQCYGNESSITDCRHEGLATHDCSHAEDASVICEGDMNTNASSPPMDLTRFTQYHGDSNTTTSNLTSLNHSLRLVGGNRCYGRLQVFYQDVWTAVCSNHWDMYDAEVVCQQLGCGNVFLISQFPQYGQGSGPVTFDIQCSGNESSINECETSGFETSNCTSALNITCGGPYQIRIQSDSTPASASVRLVGSGRRCSGRVEVSLYGQWGTVCDDSWDASDAGVVCRQLGCGYPTASVSGAQFGEGRGPIWFDEVQCHGNESSITDCSHSGIGVHDCDHGEDAGVVCEDLSNTVSSSSVRVVDSGNNCSGLVEVSYGGIWGAVCDTFWDMNDAQVVCRQLGCGRALLAQNGSDRSTSRRGTFIFHCTGNESSLTECEQMYQPIYCDNAGIICEDKQPIHQVSHLSCTRYSLEVGVPLASLYSAGLNISSGHLADPSCRFYYMSFFTMWYRVSRMGRTCGTIWMTNDTHVINFNSLYFYPETTSSSAQPVVIPFSCTYPLETTADGMAAMPETLPKGITSLGPEPSAYMTLYRDSSFISRYPYGMVTLRPGATLYVRVSVRQMRTSWTEVLEDCFVTHTYQSDGPVHYHLIRNKCPVDPMRVSLMRLRTGSAYFSARPFPTLDSNPYIFLHCRVRLCDDSVNSCTPRCSGRLGRSVHSEAQLIPVTSGPITWEK